jgi:hypothetical protein
VTVNVWPAIVSVPVRAAPPFGLTLNVTVPFPVPEPPVTIAIQFAFEAAVQAHEPSVVTATLPVPPDAATAWLEDAIE